MKYELYYNDKFLEIIDVDSLNEANKVAASLEYEFSQFDTMPRVIAREMKNEKEDSCKE